MATKQGSKSRISGLISNSKKPAANSQSSSTTSSTKQILENSMDGQSSPVSSSARSKPQYFYSESVNLDTERSKENVTVTVRFRPLRFVLNFIVNKYLFLLICGLFIFCFGV